jgi:hypothetical protein
LWLVNTVPGPAIASITLTITPPDQVPALGGQPDIGISFDDPDGSWFATWSGQAGNGVAFLVTNASGKTTVQMGESALTLAPVPLTACETRKAVAHVSPGSNDMALLTMHATLADGTVFATTDASCFNPPPV